MTHWPILLCLLAALSGALVFLGIAADELRLLDRALVVRKRLEHERRLAERAREEEVVDVGPARP